MKQMKSLFFLKYQSEFSHWHSSKVKLFHVICNTDLHSAGFFILGQRCWRKITSNKLAMESKTMHPGQGYKDSTADGFAARQLVSKNAA